MNPVPEKLVSVQELKPPEERVGTLSCSIAPAHHSTALWLPLVVLGHQAVLWALETLQPV